MNKFAIAILTATMTLGSGAALAAQGGNNGTANQAADAGAVAPGAKENLPPNNVDNSQINNSGINSNTSSTPTAGSNGMSADEMDQNAQCKDGKCPNVNEKVQTQQGGGDVDRKTDGTTQ
ncbi:YbgS-like family protein [Erwinia sp. D4-22]